MINEVLASLPPRQDLLIENVYALTMDPSIGDVVPAAISVRSGVIESLSAPTAPHVNVIDASGMVALPGLIDTHNHLWSGILRGLVADGSPDRNYNSVKRRFGPNFRPEDTYAATVIGLVEALNSGVTTVHNWAHNIRRPEDADSSLRAHAAIGLRGRFSYGVAEGLPAGSVMDLADVNRVKETLPAAIDEAMIDLGLALRGPSLTPEPVYAAEWELARALRLPATIHYASFREEVARVKVLQTLADRNFLDVELQLVHALYADSAERSIISARNFCVSCAPLAAMRHGLGFTPLTDLLADHIRVSLSLDTAGLAGGLDMFGLMRVLLMAEHARNEDDSSIIPRHVLQMATMGGALDLGLEGIVGSLTPGKRADIILVDLEHFNTSPNLLERHEDPTNLLVYSANANNVDTVIVDGRVLKRHGSLTMVDKGTLSHEGRRALLSLVDRSTA
jgi:cytosine/adenosine deaminase-related metal-dependent hydrolase